MSEEIGPTAWNSAIQRMFAEANGNSADVMAYHIRSLELCRTRELLGGCKASESSMWKEATTELTKMAIKRGYLPN